MTISLIELYTNLESWISESKGLFCSLYDSCKLYQMESTHNVSDKPYFCTIVWFIKFHQCSELGKVMKTEIRYNFEDQCFEIKGRSQMACDDTYVLKQSFWLFILKTLKKKEWSKLWQSCCRDWYVLNT